MILRNEFVCYIENPNIINLFVDRMEVKLLSHNFLKINLNWSKVGKVEYLEHFRTQLKLKTKQNKT